MATEAPRRRHDREQVLSAAEAIVDRDGASGLTMTALANQLGVKVSSLYNHVPSLDGLRGELQNRALLELGTELRDEAMGKTGEKGLRALAHKLRAFALKYPGRYALAMSEPHDRHSYLAASTNAGAGLAAIIASYGIDGVVDEALHLQISAFAALHGVITLEQNGFFTGNLDADRSYELVLGLVVDLLADAVPPEARAS
jgi:AcrR family transcriptional regulator